MADGIPSAPQNFSIGNPNVIAFERLQPCDAQWFERITLSMRLHGPDIECDTRSQRVGLLKRMLADREDSAPASEAVAPIQGKSLAKRYCGDWRHAA